MYIATTSRPDIMFAVSYLSRVLDKPSQQTWKAGKRVLRYLKETQKFSLTYKKKPWELVCYSDSDWASNKIDRKSITGCIVFYCGNPVSWLSQKQNCVALSTAEAEYIAAATSAQELIYLKGISSDFNVQGKSKLFIDNLSTIAMCQSFENSKRAKHIDIKEHYIKDLVSKQLICIDYICSENNLADILTKPLSKEKFCHLRSMSGVS
ncbi:uncharacterized protein [Diabrotica undecimpunctata]|uniref:uncharacterized protein n=1 Tax=Diabrotica undecimpunctata TaxID=50387 RepID=UPI003B635C69